MFVISVVLGELHHVYFYGRKGVSLSAGIAKINIKFRVPTVEELTILGTVRFVDKSFSLCTEKGDKGGVI